MIRFLVGLSLLSSTAFAGTKDYKVMTKKGLKHNNVFILGAYSYADGTSTLTLDACGTEVSITVPTPEVSPNNKTLEKFIDDQIAKACK